MNIKSGTFLSNVLYCELSNRVGFLDHVLVAKMKNGGGQTVLAAPSSLFRSSPHLFPSMDFYKKVSFENAFYQFFIS